MKQNNLWKATSEEKATFASLKGPIDSDITIVGGGYTGCSAALTAAENGLSVTLIDQQIGYGGSGRNVGLVNAGLWLPPKKVEVILGKNEGIKLNQALASAPDLYSASLIKIILSAMQIVRVRFIVRIRKKV